MAGGALLFSFVGRAAVVFGFSAGVVVITLIAAIHLYWASRLSEKSFVELVKMIFRKTPSVNGGDSPAKEAGE